MNINKKEDLQQLNKMIVNVTHELPIVVKVIITDPIK